MNINILPTDFGDEMYHISQQEILGEKERQHHFTPLDDTLSPITDTEVDFTPRYIKYCSDRA